MDLLADVEAKFVGQATDENIETSHVCTMIILQRFFYLKIELVVYFVLDL